MKKENELINDIKEQFSSLMNARSLAVSNDKRILEFLFRYFLGSFRVIFLAVALSLLIFYSYMQNRKNYTYKFKNLG